MMSACDQAMAAINVVSKAAAARSSQRPVSAGQGGLDRRGNPVDRVRLFDQRNGRELRRRRIDMAARSDDEGNTLAAQQARDWPHILAFQVDIEDGEIEPAAIRLLERLRDIVAGAVNIVAKRFEEILEHHGDEGLVFDDEDGTTN